MRGDIKFVEGRTFEPGRNEIVAGIGVVEHPVRDHLVGVVAQIRVPDIQPETDICDHSLEFHLVLEIGACLFLVIVAVLVVYTHYSRLYVVHYLPTNLIQHPDSSSISMVNFIYTKKTSL